MVRRFYPGVSAYQLCNFRSSARLVWFTQQKGWANGFSDEDNTTSYSEVLVATDSVPWGISVVQVGIRLLLCGFMSDRS